MDCRTCQPTLLDLAYGELAPELANVVRAHVDGCQSCGAALRALREGIAGAEQLPWLEPPPSLRHNAMAYAAQHARERSEAAAAQSASKQRGFGQGLVDFIARLASGRQFAMATVMVLVVAVGIWVVPELQPLPEGQGVTVVSPDPAGEAAPSTGLAPAAPLDLKVDTRSRRIRSREEIEAAQAAKAAEHASTEAEGYPVANEPEPPRAAAPAGDELARLSEPTAEAFEAQAPKAVRRKGSDGVSPKPAAAAQAFPGSEPIEGLSDNALSASNASERSLGAPSATRGEESKREIGGEPRADGASALERARALRSRQGCAAALPLYEQAVADHSRASPQSPVLGMLLIELAECQWQLGHVNSARATLKRAEQIGPVAVRARAMLESDVAAGAPPATQDAPAQLAEPAAAPPAPAKSKD